MAAKRLQCLVLQGVQIFFTEVDAKGKLCVMMRVARRERWLSGRKRQIANLLIGR